MDAILSKLKEKNPGLPLYSVTDPEFSRYGRILRADPEELADLRAFIDGAGEPFTNAFPAELNEIVQEELSAYFSGMGTAEDCAAKIQSRASIWLAENR